LAGTGAASGLSVAAFEFNVSDEDDKKTRNFPPRFEIYVMIIDLLCSGSDPPAAIGLHFSPCLHCQQGRITLTFKGTMSPEMFSDRHTDV
jgi:hypothetical protein